MKPLTITAVAITAFLTGLFCAHPRVITKPVPADTTALQAELQALHASHASLSLSLKQCEQAVIFTRNERDEERERSGKYLAGWRAAEARYKFFETHWEPKQAAQPANSTVPPAGVPTGRGTARRIFGRAR